MKVNDVQGLYALVKKNKGYTYLLFNKISPHMLRSDAFMNLIF
mgnify:CR=1 FL=1